MTEKQKEELSLRNKGLKRCSACKGIFLIDKFFYQRVNNKKYPRNCCKKCHMEYHKKYKPDRSYFLNYCSKYYKNSLKKHPYYNSFRDARARCYPKNKLGKRGIKFNITLEEMGKLWNRDKAFLLKDPTIDRINNNGDYRFNNCQFIERGENSRKGKL